MFAVVYQGELHILLLEHWLYLHDRNTSLDLLAYLLVLHVLQESIAELFDVFAFYSFLWEGGLLILLLILLGKLVQPLVHFLLELPIRFVFVKEAFLSLLIQA